MTLWRSFGASVRGPAHIATSTPNQDAWIAFHHFDADGVVVSDGVGSKPLSNFGSMAACLAVKLVAQAHRFRLDILPYPINPDLLFEQIKNNWLSVLSPLNSRECSATCLFAFRTGDGFIQVGMLGDGLASIVKFDGTVVSLLDDKANGFSNTTSALSSNVLPKDWRYLSLPEHECVAVLLCTDGVADDLDNIEGFIADFVESYCPLATVSANRRVRDMLEKWPTPKHSDDKTIVCLFREEAPDD